MCVVRAVIRGDGTISGNYTAYEEGMEYFDSDIRVHSVN
jgi:hypothetical protein